MNQFTHLDNTGAARMVDVGAKDVSSRKAVAEARVVMQAETAAAIRENRTQKGDVLPVARLAGIMAAKRTADLIPLCHVLPLDGVEVELEFVEPTVLRIVATAKVTGKTGVEIEALTAASVAALTVYDMCKAVDREMEIVQVRLLHKSGGKSGTFDRK